MIANWTLNNDKSIVTKRSAGIIIYCPTDRFSFEFLLLKHFYGGHWSFPKGTVETGESDWATAIRELEEETGIQNFHHQPEFTEELFYQFERGEVLIDKSVIYFLGQVADKTMVLSEEHTAFVWLPYAQARERLTHENGRQMLDKAHHFLNQT